MFEKKFTKIKWTLKECLTMSHENKDEILTCYPLVISAMF